ncbi:MAG: sugar isomerase domain-containing protein [Clostridia bacterium]|nr:sugar isomerase domain-containing protein [Clostridia bacterium]MBR2499117.1 sugar isomerase domain-containing protein [Clostridia bacterium]
MTQYFEILIDLLKKADEVNKENVKKVSNIIYECIKGDGIIYMFGCGHSSLIASDCFYRAGGLANIQPIFIPELMLHVSASNSNLLEKDQLSCKYALDGYKFTQNDVLFVFSVSGINGAPIEVAKQGKDLGLRVISIGSATYFDEKSRHSSGKNLSDYCDVFLDNCVPKGDAVIKLNENLNAVSVSTAISSAIIQSCIAEGIKSCYNDDVDIPVFGSGNLVENIENNQKLVSKYKRRIRCL